MVVVGSVVPGGGWVLFKERLMAEVLPVSRREKTGSEELEC